MQSPITQKCGMCSRSVSADPKPTTLFGLPVHVECSKSFNQKRLNAIVVDFVLVYAVLLFVLDPLFGEVGSDRVGWVPLAFAAAMLLCKDAWFGISIGKRFTDLQVVDASTNNPIGLRQSVQRNLVLLAALAFALPTTPAIGMVSISLWVIAYRMRFGPREGEGWAHTRVIVRSLRNAPVFSPPGAELARRSSLAA